MYMSCNMSEYAGHNSCHIESSRVVSGYGNLSLDYFEVSKSRFLAFFRLSVVSVLRICFVKTSEKMSNFFC